MPERPLATDEVEEAILRAARNLGAGAEREIDSTRVARRVLDRLRADAGRREIRHRRARWVGAVAIAAGMVLALVFGRPDRPPLAEPDGAYAWSFEDLSVDQLSEMLDSLAVDAPVFEMVGAGLHDLNAEQLEELLVAMEL